MYTEVMWLPKEDAMKKFLKALGLGAAFAVLGCALAQAGVTPP
jgi:hypothetical protein